MADIAIDFPENNLGGLFSGIHFVEMFFIKAMVGVVSLPWLFIKR